MGPAKMTTSQIEVESQLIELSTHCLATFWHEISAIFTVKSECNQQQATVETAEALREHFDNLAAIISIKAEGSLNETFQIVFCQKGVFALAGLMHMHSAERVLENIELASLETARQMTDAVAEAGHMLVGVFNRVFHKELAGYDGLVLTDIYIGNPREESDDKIGLPSDGEFVLVPYEVRISSYPPFACSIVFPKAIAPTSSKSDTGQPAVVEDKAQEPEVVPDRADSENADPADTTQSEEGKLQEPPEQNNATEQTTPEESTTEVSTDEQDPEAESTPSGNADTEQPGNDTNTNTTPNEESKLQELPEQNNATEQATPEESITEVSTDEQDPEAESTPSSNADTEQQVNDTGTDTPIDTSEEETASQSTPVPPDETTSSKGPAPSAPSQPNAISEVPSICAEQIMQRDLLWATQNDSVQQALAKIQQNDSSYLMIGQGETLEGIVSKSDLAGAISPYTRPIFAKWRRPLDDATLQIKMKWIMSTDIHTATPETPLGPIIEKMCQFGVRSLPVVDSQGKVKGLITTSDVFKTLLTHMSDPSAASGDA